MVRSLWTSPACLLCFLLFLLLCFLLSPVTFPRSDLNRNLIRNIFLNFHSTTLIKFDQNVYCMKKNTVNTVYFSLSPVTRTFFKGSSYRDLTEFLIFFEFGSFIVFSARSCRYPHKTSGRRASHQPPKRN